MIYSSLSTQVQTPKWEGYEEPSRLWPLDKCHYLLANAIRPDRKNAILVCGCGGTESEAFDYAHLFPMCSIVGIDVNCSSIELASNEAQLIRMPNLKFQKLNLLNNDEMANLDLNVFQAATLIGMLTNLIHDEDVRLAFNNLYDNLVVNGSLIISDCLIIEGEAYWDKRYARDLEALLKEGLFQDESAFGTIVVRPNRMNANENINLEVSELREHIKKGNYQRLARHRSLKAIIQLLENSGYNLVEYQAKQIDPTNPSNMIVNGLIRAIN